MESYPWPGNVRELKNVIQRAVIPASEDILRIGNLPSRISQYQYRQTQMTIWIGMAIAQVEKELIIRTLDHARGNRSRASEILGISRRSLYNKMARHNFPNKL